MKGSRMPRDFTPLIPQGVQCFFGEEVSRRRKVEAIVAGIMRNWGFQEIILPFFDYLDSFAYGLGPEMGDRVYRFLDKDGALLALRPDLTTLVAKTVATRMTDHRLPIKLFYSGEVFRQERSCAWKQKEFYQIGLESMGASGLWADLEGLLLAVDCLRHLGVDEYTIALGHAGFFHGIVERLNLSQVKAAALRDAIDHKDSDWLEREVRELDLPIDKQRFLIEIPEFVGGQEMLDRALAVVENPRSRKALLELREVAGVMQSLSLANHLTFDLAEVRGLDYYTGVVFKLYGGSPGMELGGGGRYDGLLSKFGWDLPAVGFSFTLDRILPMVREPGTLEIPQQDSKEEEIVVDSTPLSVQFGRIWDLRSGGRRVCLRSAS